MLICYNRRENGKIGEKLAYALQKSFTFCKMASSNSKNKNLQTPETHKKNQNWKTPCENVRSIFSGIWLYLIVIGGNWWRMVIIDEQLMGSESKFFLVITSDANLLENIFDRFSLAFWLWFDGTRKIHMISFSPAAKVAPFWAG